MRGGVLARGMAGAAPGGHPAANARALVHARGRLWRTARAATTTWGTRRQGRPTTLTKYLLVRCQLLLGIFVAWVKTNRKFGAYSGFGLDTCNRVVLIEDFPTYSEA